MKAWEVNYEGYPMHRLAAKIKACRVRILAWNREHNGNAAVKIQKIKVKMEHLAALGGQRDWSAWYNLKEQLDLAYQEEEKYWSQKSRVQWLKE